MVAEPTVCAHERPVLEGYECAECTREVHRQNAEVLYGGIRQGIADAGYNILARVEEAWIEACILACESCAKGVALRSWDQDRREWVVDPRGLHHVHPDGSHWTVAVCPALPLREHARKKGYHV